MRRIHRRGRRGVRGASVDVHGHGEGRRRIAAIALVAFALCVAVSGTASAEPGEIEGGGAEGRVSLAPGFDRSVPFEITADRIEYRAGRDLYVAEGRVRIVRGARRLDADWVAFSPSTRRGIASGGVIFEDEARTLESRFVSFDTETLEGSLYEGELEIDGEGMRVEAEELVQIGDDTYRVYDAVLTTCRCPDEDDREPWRLRASRSEIELGEYGQSLNSTVEVLGVPVFWLPWILYPVKTERQSGLLFPQVGVGGRNRFDIGIPFFWAATDDLNLTYTPSWSFRRGFKHDLDLETVYGDTSYTNLGLAFSDDTEINRTRNRLNRSLDHFDEKRWSVDVDHSHQLADAVRIRAAGLVVSDNQIPLDYPEHRRRDTDRRLEAVVYGTVHLGDDRAQSLRGGARLTDDRQNPNDRDRDRTMLQRWPEVSADVLPAPLPLNALDFLVPSLDADYVRFSQRRNPNREYGAGTVGDALFADVGIDALPSSLEVPRAVDVDNFDPVTNPSGTEGNGRFDVGEPLNDEGHRLVLHPRLQWPMHFFGVFDFTPEIGYQQTLYWSDRLGFEHRGMSTARADLRTRIRGIFELGSLGQVRHTIEPRVGWAFRDDVDAEGSDPFFVPEADVQQERIRLEALDNYTLEAADRMERENVLVMAIENRFARVRKGGAAGAPIADLSLSGLMDLTDGGFRSLLLNARLFPLGGFSARGWALVDPRQGELRESLVSIQGRTFWDITAGFDYRYNQRVPRFFENFLTEGSRFGRFEEELDRVHQISARIRIPIFDRWAIAYRANYGFDTNSLLSNGGSVEYFSKCKCWGIALDVQQNRNLEWNVGVRFTLVGPGQRGDSAFAGRSVDRVGGDLFQ